MAYLYLRAGPKYATAEQALAEAERAVALDPNYAYGNAILGETLNWMGRGEEGIPLIQKAMRLDPYPRFPSNYENELGQAYWLAGRIEEGLVQFKKSISHNPNYKGTHRHMIVIYSELGRMEEARAQLAELLKFAPKESIARAKRKCWYKRKPAVLKRWIDGLRNAGMPETSESVKL